MASIESIETGADASENDRMWPHVAGHLARYLSMDPEWTLLYTGGLMWWPGPLPQRIQVIDEHPAPKSDEILLQATTDLFYIPGDEELGSQVARTLNETFHFGSFYWSDDVVRASTTLAWTRGDEQMLGVLRQACLQQATRANQVALCYLGVPSAIAPEPNAPFEQDGFVVCEQPHPGRGIRYKPDEILTIYAGSQTLAPEPDDLVERVAAARDSSRIALQQEGFRSEHGPGTAEWLTRDDVDILLRPLREPAQVAKYGAGLMLRVPVLHASEPTSSIVLNSANVSAVLNSERGYSQLGPVVWDEHFGIHMRVILDAAALTSSEDLAPLLTSTVLQVAAAAEALRPGSGK